MRKIKVLVVDDHPFFRQGLRDVLGTRKTCTSSAKPATVKKRFAQSRNLMPDVVVMDVNIPSLNGIQVTRKLRAERSPGQRRDPDRLRR